jgi:hypothetical protein
VARSTSANAVSLQGPLSWIIDIKLTVKNCSGDSAQNPKSSLTRYKRGKIELKKKSRNAKWPKQSFGHQ